MDQVSGGKAVPGRSFDTDHEETFDVLCKPCEEEGIHREGTWYCIECKSNFCRICYRQHDKFLKGHTVLEASKMPKLKTDTTTPITSAVKQFQNLAIGSKGSDFVSVSENSTAALPDVRKKLPSSRNHISANKTSPSTPASRDGAKKQTPQQVLNCANTAGNTTTLIKSVVLTEIIDIGDMPQFTYVTDMVFLSDGSLAVVSSGYKSNLKLTDNGLSKYVIFTGVFADEGYCRNIVAISLLNKVAVTFPWQKKIRFYTIPKTGTNSEPCSQIQCVNQISTTGKCFGLVYSQDKFIVSMIEPTQIQIMDMRGRVEQTLLADKPDISNFPAYLALSPDHSFIYVSDNDSVKCLTRDGHVLATYSNKDLSGKGLAVSTEGSIFVCASTSVYQISANCSKIQSIHIQIHGTSLESLTYCPINNKLYIWGYNSQQINVYQLN